MKGNTLGTMLLGQKMACKKVTGVSQPIKGLRLSRVVVVVLFSALVDGDRCGIRLLYGLFGWLWHRRFGWPASEFGGLHGLTTAKEGATVPGGP